MARMGGHRLPPLPSAGELLRLYKLRALRKLSQNFLLDPKLCSKLVRAAGRLRGAHVCEVGPGPGNLTRAMLEQGVRRVTVVEKDARFLPALQTLQEVSGGALEVCLGDAKTFNMEHIFPTSDSPWEGRPPNTHIIGNLPFSVATPLTVRWLEDISLRRNAWVGGRTRLTLTYQQEVAQRMVAPPGHAQRCRLSLMCQNWCHIKHCFTIPGRAFVPPPDVNVGVVHLTPLVAPAVPLPFPLVEKVARCLFAFRQKYCSRGAGTLFPTRLRDGLVDKLFKVADVDPTLRPFQLTMEEFSRLCHTYKAILDQNPALAKLGPPPPHTMNVSRAEHWQMLALLYRHGTNIKALNAAVSRRDSKKLEHYVKCHRLGSHQRIHKNVYGVDGVSSWVGEMRLRRSFATHSQSGCHTPLLTKNQKAMKCLSLWLAHTHNTQKVQRTAIQKRKKGRKPKNYCPVDHGPLLSKVMLFLSQEEEHPSPSSSSQPDYSEIYRYLSQVLAGQEPTQLSQGSAVKVLEMIKRVQRVANSSQDLKKLRRHLSQNLTSYLMPWMKKANCSPSTTSQEEGCNSNMEECPLFQEVDDEEELDQWRGDIKTQGRNDPHYEMKKEKLMKKCKEKQAVVSSNISNMPGLNPFLLPPNLLFKVEDDTMNTLL